MYKLVAILSVSLLVVTAFAGDQGMERRVEPGVGPTPILFVASDCGQGCIKLRKSLSQRLYFREYDVSDGGAGSELYANLGGTGSFPYLVIGDQRIAGNYPGELLSAIAIEFGAGPLSDEERAAFSRNFDERGEPRFVMYANEWCKFCDEARDYFQERGVELVEFDIEQDTSARKDFDVLYGRGTPLLYQGYKRVDGMNIPKIERNFDLDSH